MEKSIKAAENGSWLHIDLTLGTINRSSSYSSVLRGSDIHGS